MVIHSFDQVLRAPRSIHSIEITPGGKRIPLWKPIPWIGLLYFVALELVLFSVDNMIPLSSAVNSIFSLLVGADVYLASIVISYLLIPIGIVWLAMLVEIDGRSPHQWAASTATYLGRPKRTLGGRRLRHEGAKSSYRGRVRFWWGVDAPRLHHGWIAGGRFSTRHPVRFTFSLRHMKQVVKPSGSGVLAVDYTVDDKVEVRS